MSTDPCKLTPDIITILKENVSSSRPRLSLHKWHQPAPASREVTPAHIHKFCIWLHDRDWWVELEGDSFVATDIRILYKVLPAQYMVRETQASC